jgi:uncharacterized membrane protein
VIFTPLLEASAAIRIHTAAAAFALAAGSGVLVLQKGTPLHRAIGWVFVGLMTLTALTSFAITRLIPGHYSPIHILSVVTLIALPLAILQRRRGNIKAHAIGMIATFLGLFIAGFFTLMPGRLLHDVFFGS